ncbi:plasmid mobilization relaxosome protein MobC [Sulfurimonas sp.]|uniref:plasmid mobilization relaxosome protein MobC n=1 Tax=Sulfurimonas sp. TaxID=2022749 RepID=UPI002637604D|nr:plasmid mobilization relaxosome protein MobC [Sulfurimonas sp.]
MSQSNYQKEYKKSYNSKNKIVTFPLSTAFYDELKRRAIFLDLKTNSYAKSIVTSFLNNNTPQTLSIEQKEFISEYIRISRGIANNINQIAHKTNMTEQIDINILINALRQYEEEFKKFIAKT